MCKCRKPDGCDLFCLITAILFSCMAVVGFIIGLVYGYVDTGFMLMSIFFMGFGVILSVLFWFMWGSPTNYDYGYEDEDEYLYCKCNCKNSCRNGLNKFKNI